MADQPQHLAVWLCPVCTGGALLLPASPDPQRGEYELQVVGEHDEDADTRDGECCARVRGVYLTRQGVLDCLAMHEAARTAVGKVLRAVGKPVPWEDTPGADLLARINEKLEDSDG